MHSLDVIVALNKLKKPEDILYNMYAHLLARENPIKTVSSGQWTNLSTLATRDALNIIADALDRLLGKETHG